MTPEARTLDLRMAGLPTRPLSQVIWEENEKTDAAHESTVVEGAAQMGLRFDSEDNLIPANIGRFANLLQAKIAEKLGDRPILVKTAEPHTTCAFSTARMDKVTIYVPDPKACYRSYKYSPLADKRAYRIQHYPFTDKLMYKDRPALISGASVIFCVFLHKKLLEGPEFDAWLEKFVGSQQLNLFAYAERALRLVDTRRQRAQTYVKEAEARVASAQGEMRKAVLNLQSQQDVERLATGDVSVWMERIKRGVEQLQQLVPSRYERFLFAPSGGKIAGYTQPVEIQHHNETYVLGKYEVEIDFDVNRYRVRSLESDGRRIPHPHIDVDGYVCLGNIERSMHDLIGQFEVFGAFFTFHNYLSSYNKDSIFEPVESWRTQSQVAQAKELADEPLETIEEGQTPEVEGESPRVAEVREAIHVNEENIVAASILLNELNQAAELAALQAEVNPAGF